MKLTKFQKEQRRLIVNGPNFIQLLCDGKRGTTTAGKFRKTGNVKFIWIAKGLKKYRTVILSGSEIISYTKRSTI